MPRPSNASAMKAGAAANQPLLQALGAFQAGRPADCARLCETILAKHAKDPGALHLLGVARLRLGDSDGAVRALALAPRSVADFYREFMAALRALGLATPRYLHFPVAVDARGEKLSKQNLAPALGRDSAAGALRAALAFLGQATDELPGATARERLDAAARRWNPERIPRAVSLAVAPESG